MCTGMLVDRAAVSGNPGDNYERVDQMVEDEIEFVWDLSQGSMQVLCLSMHAPGQKLSSLKEQWLTRPRCSCRGNMRRQGQTYAGRERRNQQRAQMRRDAVKM